MTAYRLQVRRAFERGILDEMLRYDSAVLNAVETTSDGKVLSAIIEIKHWSGPTNKRWNSFLVFPKWEVFNRGMFRPYDPER
jgi:ABC-type taurine transport system substrate-binding protein